ncbi:MAG TPA: ATP-binding protein, partial [Sulfurimonas sp.]|nr:ATP-binding protein [Sulfurimonas sp.]
PLEDKHIMVSRVNTKIEYPTDIMFLAAMNPCPCGNLLHIQKSCRCTDLEVQRYKNRLSEPFLDRIDISIQMQAVRSDDVSSLSSSEMHKNVFSALGMRDERGQISPNGKIQDEEIPNYCQIDGELKELLRQASENFGLSFRSVNKILKVARTISDLALCENIQKDHLLEAMSYRRR